MRADLCTFHHRGESPCGRPENDPIHPRPEERMPHGGHVWRHEPERPAPLRDRSGGKSTEYLRGYSAGFKAGQRSR